VSYPIVKGGWNVLTSSAQGLPRCRGICQSLILECLTPELPNSHLKDSKEVQCAVIIYSLLVISSYFVPVTCCKPQSSVWIHLLEDYHRLEY
jgi:hypothetical protein